MEARVLGGHRRQRQQSRQLVELGVGGGEQVQPEELAALAQRSDLRGIETVEDLHPAPRP
jgi:hypothetical protein